MMWLHKAIATVFGLGYAPKAPGTFGTLGAVLFLSLSKLLDISIAPCIMAILIIVLTLLGIYSTDRLIIEWDQKDPQRVVLDEFVGYLITMFLVPLSWPNIVLGFLLFRFFDILKPLGIRYLDKQLPGGLGVMMDDVLAGIYACVVLHGIIYFL